MAEEKRAGAGRVASANEISDETGQYDVRFILWRTFCAEYNVPVETLPGDLKGEIRERWEKMKDRQLHQPVEDGEAPPR